MPYRRCGRSGLQLPAISLGLWHNFGDDRPLDTQRAILRRAFDLGVTHFDLANNYGPPYGSAETNFGRILREDFAPVPRRAGHLDQGRLRHVARPVRRAAARASTCSPRLDQSLARMGLDYVDIFYSHRFDPDTPLEETMGALDTAVRSGQGAVRRHLVVLGASAPREAARILRELGTPLLIHQPSYSMLNRWIEDGPARRARRGRRRRASRSRRSPRACSPTGTSTASRRTRARRTGGSLDAEHAHRREPRARPRAQRDRRRARPVARAAGARLGAARPARDLVADRRLAASRSSRTTSPRSTTSTSPTTSSPRSTRTRVDGGINLWAQSSRS